MNTFKTLSLAFLLVSGLSLLPDKSSAQHINVNLSVFQKSLSAHGQWVNSPRYGQVWVYNEPGFRPYYTRGHWEYTDYGWAWISDYDWGWGPFHYGRWEEDPFYGWIWIPGYEWAPAWVSWSEYGGNYGWAPLGHGLNVNVSFNAIPFNRWVFVPRVNICSPNLHNYYINPGRHRGFRNAVVINNIYVDNSTRFSSGPRRNEVERYTRSRVPVRTVNRPERLAMNDRRGNDRSASVNRPDRNDRNVRENNGRLNENRSSNNLPQREARVERPSGRERNSSDARGNRSSSFPQANRNTERPSTPNASERPREQRPTAPNSSERPREQRPATTQSPGRTRTAERRTESPSRETRTRERPSAQSRTNERSTMQNRSADRSSRMSGERSNSTMQQRPSNQSRQSPRVENRGGRSSNEGRGNSSGNGRVRT